MPGSQNYWKEYWSGKVSGGHRSSSKRFLDQEAAEKLFHLRTQSHRLLDLGCGAGELLSYYAIHFQSVVGVDFSPSMLEQADRRLQQNETFNVRLIQGDDQTVWATLGDDSPFDVVTTAGVVQYLTSERLRSLVGSSLAHLSPNGAIVFFDVIDPRLYALVEMGLLPHSPATLWSTERTSLLRILRSGLAMLKHRLSGWMRGVPVREIGYTHHPATFVEIASRFGLEVKFAGSMYYEYRYHVILTHASNSATEETTVDA